MLNPTYEKAVADVGTKPDIFFGHLFITVAISRLKSQMELSPSIRKYDDVFTHSGLSAE